MTTETSPLLNKANARQSCETPESCESYDSQESHESDDTHSSCSNGPTDGDGDEHVVRVEMSNARIALVLVAANIGYLMAAIDHTILATLTGPITSSIASLSIMPYLAAAYTLTLTPCVALNGRLGDIFGRGRMLTGAMALMAAGSLLVGLSPAKEKDDPSPNYLGVAVFLAGRVLTGMGAGPALIQPILLAGDLLPQRSRGLAQGITSVSWGVGCVLGGVMGGVINDSIGWRWAFFLQVPICIGVGIVAATCINVPPKVSKSGRGYWARIDFAGAGLLVATLFTFQMPLNAGGTFLPWSHPAITAMFILAIVSAVLLIRVELRARQPILPVRVFVSSRNVPLACLFGMLAVTIYVYALYYIPLFFQVVGGQSTTQAGLRLLIVSLGDIISGIAGGWATKATGRYVPVGIACMAVGMAGYAILSTLDDTSASVLPGATTLSPTLANLALLLVGAACGSPGLVASLGSVASVPHDAHAAIITALQIFRESGATIGIATSGALLQNLLRSALRRRFGDMPDAESHIERILESVLTKNFPDGWAREDIMSAFVEAFRGIWIAGVVAAGIALVGVASLKQYRLRDKL